MPRWTRGSARCGLAPVPCPPETPRGDQGGMDQKIASPVRAVNGSLSVGLPPRIGRASRWNEAAPEMSARASAKSAVSEAGTKPILVADLSAGRR